MKILSWDVGIKNLAFVFFECCDETNICTIIKWDVINLLPVNPVCCHKKCKQKVSSSCICDDVSYYWCAKHSNVYDAICEATESKPKISKYKYINCNNIDLDELRESLVDKLDEIIYNLIKEHTIDFVLIENQPALKNPRMKGLADTLYCWHLIRGKKDTNSVENIKPVNATHKLRAYKKELDKYKGREKYNKTKALSIEIASKFLKDNNMEEWEQMLIAHDKKDDLCDCLLQGLYWIS